MILKSIYFINLHYAWIWQCSTIENAYVNLRARFCCSGVSVWRTRRFRSSMFFVCLCPEQVLKGCLTSSMTAQPDLLPKINEHEPPLMAPKQAAIYRGSAIKACTTFRAPFNEALSDVNKSLDGCTYPGWKLTHIANQNNFLDSAKGNRLSSRTSSATYLHLIIFERTKWLSMGRLRQIAALTPDENSTVSSWSKYYKLLPTYKLMKPLH